MPVPVPTVRSSTIDKIVLPDLVSQCHYALNLNTFGKKVGSASEAWLVRQGNLSVKKQRSLHGLKSGLITSMCYPDAPEYELRVCCDYINYLFHLDNISDSMDGVGTVNTQEVVMGSLRNPATYKSSSRVSRMTKEYVCV